MSKRFVHPEGSEAFPNDPKDETTLRKIGFKEEGDQVVEEAESPTKPYKVLAPFQYQGEKYEQNDEVDLPDEEAAKREGKLELIV